ncbi:hypothetical protein SAMN05428976_102130 [Clostridium sp. USBA 49]|uniref:hypothetical protein n=1 Tax=Clostridium TaxID=1485 RepID=UPI00099AFBDB|nr:MULTISPECIES: hypothetical protein [Clostridium]SKA75522.1 hypothetical protein SAMN05428976_102130 [Clostridium sp. USBA 49]
MLENIIETDIFGSNIVYLNIPEEDYFLSYEDVTKEAAEEITKTFFLMRGREGIPEVKNIEFIEPLHSVRITLDVKKQEGSYKTGYAVPTHLDITKNNEPL